MDAITFSFFISLVATKNLMCAYLYESLDNNIYIKTLEGYRIPKAYNSKFLKDIVLHQIEDIGVGSSMYCVTFVEQLT